MKARTLDVQQSGTEQSHGIPVPGICPADYACYWVKLGFGVFPMLKGMKKPVVDDWPRLAFTSVDDIETYWHSFCRPGWTNLALTLPNHVVVDVDPKNDGWTGLARLEEDFGPMPATRRHRTGSGGLHLIYAQHPVCDGLLNKPLDPWKYPGIDIKVNGNGLIVAPGSESRAGRYSIVDDRECAPAPAFLLDVQKNARYQPTMNAPHASYGAARMTFDELADLPADDPYRSSYPWNGQVCGHLAKKHFPNYEVYVTEAIKLNDASIDPHPNFTETADRIWSKEQAKRAQDAAGSAAVQEQSRRKRSGGQGGKATPTAVAAVPSPADQLQADTSILWGHERTDLGNGRRLRDVYGQELRHAPGWGWLTWDGRRWARDESQARRFMHDVVDEIEEAAKGDSFSGGKEVREWLSRTASSIGISAALKEAAVMLPIAAQTSDFDRDPYKLLVGNGVVDLRAGQLSPFRREDMLTRGTTVEYAPDAECPLWLDFLGWAFQGDVEMIEYVQRMFGMCLIGNNAHQVAFFLYGPGRSGKSTLTRVLSWLLGDYAVSADLSVFNEANGGHNEPLARLAGARLVIFSETRAGQRINEAQFKKFTGEDTLSASFKNRGWFDFVPAFTPVMFGNAQPSIAFDSGVERRMKVVPMKARITDSQKDPKLFERLTSNEGPAIMAWAVRGAQMAAADVFVPEPPQVAEAVKEYKRENDHMAEFIEDCLVFGDDLTVPSENVWVRYTDWVESGGVDFIGKGGSSRLVREIRTWSVENGTPIETFRSSNIRKLRGVAVAPRSNHGA